MITAIVRFRLPEGTTRDDAKAMFEKSAPNYRGVPGLVRKYYLFSSGSTICMETIEPEGAFIFGTAVRPQSGSIPRRGRARSPSDMGRSRKSHFTTHRSSSRTWIRKPAPRERCQPTVFTT
jgi:hypothetical protein